MIRRIIISIFIIFSIIETSYSQNYIEEIQENPLKAGGVYYAYPVLSINNSPPPKGYKPIYISHIGRHGSRYLLKEDDYLNPLKILEIGKQNNILTNLGDSLLTCLQNLYHDVRYRSGDLTSLGVRQHRGIAERMFNKFTQVFSDSTEIYARSTMVMRCAMSMAAFTEKLKELNPKLRIKRDPSERNAMYMNYQSKEAERYNSAEGPWKAEYRKIREKYAPYKSLLPKIFVDTTLIRGFVNPVDFTCRLYTIIVGLQNLDKDYYFPNIFETSDLINLWKIYNYRMYAHYSNYKPSKKAVILSSRPLLQEIIESADKALKSDIPIVDLRFGHDINIIPLAGLIGLDGASSCVDNPDEIPFVFQDYNISPMASNIQFIFYKNKEMDVLVKVLHNEKETTLPLITMRWPYYSWDEVRQYFNNLINE